MLPEEVIEDMKQGETLGGKLNLEIAQVESLERSNYNMDVLVYFIDPLTIKLRYNTLVYDSGFMRKLARDIEDVADQVITNTSITARDIRISHDRPAVKTSIPIDNSDDFEL